MSGDTPSTCDLGEKKFLSEVVLLITIALSFTYILAAFHWATLNYKYLEPMPLKMEMLGIWLLSDCRVKKGVLHLFFPDSI